MELSPLSSGNTAPLSASETSSAATALSSDFETFIRMLTAQMKNQDPLNPIESADFATQLATFSGVEQQVKTNELLSGLGAQIGALGVAQLASWIGMEGRAVAPVQYDGSPVTLTISGNALADRHEFVVRDVFENEVQRFEVSGVQQEIAWQGRDSEGNLLPSGTYQVSVEAFSGNERIATMPSQVHGRIMEARAVGEETILVFESGQEIQASALVGLRLPE